VTPQLIAPVIPSRSRVAVRAGGRAGWAGDRAVIGTLGWRPGDQLTLTAAAGVVIARRDPAGLIVMPAKPYVVIPAALRRRCGLRPGDRVLLAVFPGEDALAAHSFAAVDRALRAHSSPAQGAGGAS
jgi:hypothetical protein